MRLLPAVDGAHVWRFFRAGGTDQVLLDTADDLRNLRALDQKLWVALGCPVSGLEFDEKTLKLLDTDGDGRIRVPEIAAAVEWAGTVLKDIGALRAGAEALPLSAIDDSGEEGKRLLTLAREVLKTEGKGGAGAIAVGDVADSEKFFAGTRFNGDGVVTADSADDAATRALIADIMECVGSVPDRGGKAGVDKALVDKFFAEAAALAAWRDAGAGGSALLGDKTADALAAFSAVRAKADDYFARCRTAAYDARAVAALNRPEADYAPLAGLTLATGVPELAAFPLARVEAGRALPLDGGVNPAWADAVARLRSDAVLPALGDRTALTEAEWRGLQERFAAQEKWLSAKPATRVETLGAERLKAALAAGRGAVDALIAKDLELKPQFDSVQSLERLARYHRDLYRLLCNFVSFTDFYGRKRKAVFQAGTLYIDGRSCELCVRVEDMAKHSALAALSQTYLLYCECVRRATGEKMTVAAAVTGGDSDNLMVGRNGVFYDRKGRDWDATVVKIVDNPISIRQAFWSPYKKVVRLVEAQIHKFASEREKASHDAAAAGVDHAGKAIAGVPPKPEAFDVGKFAGIFAAIGLAMGALGAAFGAVVAAFSRLAAWQMPLALAGAVLLVSGPSMLIAALKLRQRNLGPILDANGWAVNALVRINIPFGGALTGLAELPANASRTLDDPYADESRAPQWAAAGVLAVAAVAAWLAARWYSARP
ncbi:MAG: hypothetical protein HY079_01270 [Elusimicrobia bacterium]|nr:hypothetical protein [Elusimicrobiota bacterium]